MLTNVDMATFIKALLKRSKETYPDKATVSVVDGAYANIRVGQSPTLLRHIKIIGEPASIAAGQTVSLRWETPPGGYPTPVILAAESTSTPSAGGGTVVDNLTIQKGPYGLQVKPGGLNMGHLNFTPALIDHSHPDMLTEHGWNLTDGGVLYSGQTFIHPTGQIALGEGLNIIKLDSLHDTYRLWAGATEPEDAVFSVSKTGDLHAASGDIGGWNITGREINSDSGNAAIDSLTPSIRLGASTYTAGNGFWVGLNAGVYKLRVGDPSGDRLEWNGTTLTLTGGAYLGDLYVSGLLQSSNFASGLRGWSVNGADGTAEFGDVRVRGTLHSTVFEYNEVAATAGTLGIFYSAAKLDTAVTTPADSTPFTIVGDGPVFAVGHRLRLKSATVDNWLEITVLGDRTGSLTTYTVIRRSGTAGTFEAGQAIADYGPSGSGFITLSADGTVGSSPNMTMATHAGSPWSAITPLLRIGKLDGYGALTGYGWAVGDPASSEYAYYTPSGGLVVRGTITADDGTLGALTVGGLLSLNTTGELRAGSTTNGIRFGYITDGYYLRGVGGGATQFEIKASDGKLYAGAGAVTLDADGISLALTTTEQTPRQLKFKSGSTVVGGLKAYDDTVGVYMTLFAEDGNEAMTALKAGNGGANFAQFILDTAGESSRRAWVYHCGLAVDLDAYPADGDVYVGNDTRVAGGLYVGSTVADPAAGEIWLNGLVNFRSEISDPAAPSANMAKLYIKDNGSGKTQLCVLFSSGAVQVLATQP